MGFDQNKCVWMAWPQNHFYIKETVNDFMAFEEIVEKNRSIFL